MGFEQLGLHLTQKLCFISQQAEMKNHNKQKAKTTQKEMKIKIFLFLHYFS